MHKPGLLNIIYMYDEKFKYFNIKDEFYINSISHLCIKLMYNVFVYRFTQKRFKTGTLNFRHIFFTVQ